MLHLYFDMDGVLVQFFEQDSITKPFNILGRHYFKDLPADTKAVDLLQSMRTMQACTADILTRVYIDLPDKELERRIVAEHVMDKQEWCRTFTPGPGNVICVTQTADKCSVLEKIPLAERKDHVLIDDDPVMLDKWQASGGTGVQYLQHGRNVATWHNGRRIGTAMLVPEMARILLSAPTDDQPPYHER